MLTAAKSPTYYYFENASVDAGCESNAITCIELPSWVKISINGKEELVLLHVDGIKAFQRAQGSIIFNSRRKYFSNLVTKFEIWCEYQSRASIGTHKGSIEHRIECQVHRAYLFINDRSDFQRPYVWIIALFHKASFKGDTDS